MKPYSILIHGTGTCGEGNAASADMVLQKMLEQLRTAGHTLTSVSMVINGNAVPIIGALQPHPAANETADPDAVTLASLGGPLNDILNMLVSLDEKTVLEAVVIDGETLTVPRGLKTIYDQLDRIEAAQKKEGARAKKEPTPKPAKKEGAGEPAAPSGTPVDKDGKAQVPAAPVEKAEGSLPLAGSTGAADGDNQTLLGTTTAKGEGAEPEITTGDDGDDDADDSDAGASGKH